MDFTRQTDIINPDDIDQPVTVVGVGGIGSPTVLAIAKMGVKNLTVYDDDFVEPHNLPNQLYRDKDIGHPKVEALKEIVREFTAEEIEAIPEKFNGQEISGVVVSGVDSMKARKKIWKGIKYNPAVPVYIEARMGGEFCRIYTVNPCTPDEIDAYEATLYDDDSAQEAPCTARAIIYNVFLISSFLANQVKKFVKGEELKFEIMFDIKSWTMMVK